MKAKCIDNIGAARLTMNKLYNIIGLTFLYIKVKNDINVLFWYNIDRFETINHEQYCQEVGIM